MEITVNIINQFNILNNKCNKQYLLVVLSITKIIINIMSKLLNFLEDLTHEHATAQLCGFLKVACNRNNLILILAMLHAF